MVMSAMVFLYERVWSWGRRRLGQLESQFGESGGDGAVDDLVADLHAQAADDGGVDAEVDPRLEAVLLRERLAQLRDLLGGERLGRGDDRDEPAGCRSHRLSRRRDEL